MLIEQHDDWVTLDSLPEWPTWLALAQNSRPEVGPALLGPIRWPVWLGGSLAVLALLIHLGLFTWGNFPGVNFAAELGGLGLGAVLTFLFGRALKRRIDRERSPQRPPIRGIVLLTVGAGLMLWVLPSVKTWSTYQANGAQGVALEASLRGVKDSQILSWASWMHESQQGIYNHLEKQDQALRVNELRGKEGDVLSSVQAAHDRQQRALQAAQAYLTAATELQRLVQESNDRLQLLSLDAELRQRQQKAFDGEIAPWYRAEADFLKAKGDSLAAVADLMALLEDLIRQGELTSTSSGPQIKSKAANAEYLIRFQRLEARKKEEARLLGLLEAMTK